MYFFLRGDVVYRVRVLWTCSLIFVLISNIVFPVSAVSIHYISNESELFSLENDSKAVYVLTNDIYLDSSHSMMFTERENAFKGVLDGNGYTIYNLKIDSNDFPYLAFIGFLGNGGVIKDLKFENSSVTTENEGVFLSGIVAKNISGRIENCVFSGVLSVAGKVLEKEYYVCALGAGDVINSYYYLKHSAHDEPRSKEEMTVNSVSEHSSAPVFYTESVTQSTVESSSSNPSSKPKTPSSSKEAISTSSETESAAVYGDVSSTIKKAEEEKSGKFVFYAAVFLLLLLLGYMIYTEIKFRINKK